MINTASINNLLKSIIPISRFNKGEANKIFEEVQDVGYKLVIKNNNPACVLVSIENFSEMVEEIENYHLLIEANKRMTNTSGITYTHEEILDNYNIKVAELDEVEVDIE